MINETSRLRLDYRMAKVGGGLKIMNIEGRLKDMRVDLSYEDLRGKMYSDSSQGAEFALQVGVSREEIVVAPGLCFSNRSQDNLVVRPEGGAAAGAWGMAKGADILKVQGVEEIASVARMAHAITEADGTF